MGSVFRYSASVLTEKYVRGGFPWATFCVNLVGCLAIGMMIGLLGKQPSANPDMKLLLVTGFCGGFTTFSTFALENVRMIQDGNGLSALLYIVLSVLLGGLAVWAGTILFSHR